MFEDFPKTRPALPKEIADIYVTHYQSNRAGQTTASSLAQRLESWMHRQVAKDVTNLTEGKTKSTLELGAGTLNQLAYEPISEVYDIVEPFQELFQGSDLLDRIRNVYADIGEVPESSRYDRITSIATLEHVCPLPEVVARSGLLLAEGGSFRASIPSEGTWLWTLGWSLTTGLEFRLRHGQDYGTLMKYEHVNNAQEIEGMLTHFFRDIKSRVFGLNKAISLYRFYECRDPDLDRCREYLSLLDI
jgi:hypothetical protein